VASLSSATGPASGEISLPRHATGDHTTLLDAHIQNELLRLGVRVHCCYLGGADYAWVPDRNLLMVEANLKPTEYPTVVAAAVAHMAGRRRHLVPVRDVVARVTGFTTTRPQVGLRAAAALAAATLAYLADAITNGWLN